MATGRSKTKSDKRSERGKGRGVRQPQDLSEAVQRLQTVFADASSQQTSAARLAEIWLRLHRTLRGIVLPQLERSDALEFESAVLGLDEWSAAALVDVIDCPPTDASYDNRLAIACTLIELELAAELAALDAALRGHEFDAARVAFLSDALGDVVIFEESDEPDIDAVWSALKRRTGRAKSSRTPEDDFDNRRQGRADRFVENRGCSSHRAKNEDHDSPPERVSIPRRGSDYPYEDFDDFERPAGREHSGEERRRYSRERDYDDRRD